MTLDFILSLSVDDIPERCRNLSPDDVAEIIGEASQRHPFLNDDLETLNLDVSQLEIAAKIGALLSIVKNKFDKAEEDIIYAVPFERNGNTEWWQICKQEALESFNEYANSLEDSLRSFCQQTHGHTKLFETDIPHQFFKEAESTPMREWTRRKWSKEAGVDLSSTTGDDLWELPEEDLIEKYITDCLKLARENTI